MTIKTTYKEKVQANIAKLNKASEAAKVKIAAEKQAIADNFATQKSDLEFNVGMLKGANAAQDANFKQEVNRLDKADIELTSNLNTAKQEFATKLSETETNISDFVNEGLELVHDSMTDQLCKVLGTCSE